MDFNTTPLKVVIVTYSDRWSLLSKTLESVLKHKSVNEVVVVQNGIDYDLAAKVKSNSKISLIQSENNLGSAGGFRLGLEKLLTKKAINFNVLILDDDNILAGNVFNELSEAEKLHHSSVQHIWSLFRPNVQSNQHFEASKEKSLESLSNTVNGFTLMHFFNKQYKYAPRKYSELATLITAPYSGLIFPVRMLHEIGLPKQEFYLYSDDIDFTLRVTKNGYEILQYEKAQAFDQGIAWQVLDEQKVKNRSAFFSTTDLYRPLYTYRNELFISYHILKNNSLLFWMNYYLLLLWMLVSYMPHTKEGVQRFKLLRKSMRDGINGTLGQSDWIERTKNRGE